jgi:hypothetical protein
LFSARHWTSKSCSVLSLLLPLDESQQTGTVQGEPGSTLRSWPQTNDQRSVGNVIESPLRTGHGIRTSSTVVRPWPGGHGPLLDGSLDEGSLLDDSLLDDGSLDDGSLLDEDSLELLDELLSLEELLLDDTDEDELDDELLDEEELLLELDDEDELEESQQPSPSCTTSHFWLSASHLAQPYVPAGTLSASVQPQSPPDVPPAWHTLGQTTPSESYSVNGQSASHHLGVPSSVSLYTIRTAAALPQRDRDESNLNRRKSSGKFDRRTTAHCFPSPPSRHRMRAEPTGRLSSTVGSSCFTSANSWHSSSTSMYAGQVPLTQARPILPTRSGSSRIMNRPKWSGCLGFTPTSATWFLNSRRCEPGVMIGDEMPST